MHLQTLKAGGRERERERKRELAYESLVISKNTGAENDT